AARAQNGAFVDETDRFHRAGHGSRGPLSLGPRCMIDRAFRRRVLSPRMSMQPLRINVDIVMERVPLTNRWASEMWRPFAVLPAPASGATEAPPAPDEIVPGSRWCFRSHVLELHPSEAEGYFLNLTAPAPCVFVMWRMDEDGAPALARPVLATLSYNE